MTTAYPTEADNVSDIDSRFTGRQTRGSKPLWTTEAMHALVKHESVRRGTTLFETTFLLLCSGLQVDPETLEPIGIRVAS